MSATGTINCNGMKLTEMVVDFGRPCYMVMHPWQWGTIKDGLTSSEAPFDGGVVKLFAGLPVFLVEAMDPDKAIIYGPKGNETVIIKGLYWQPGD